MRPVGGRVQDRAALGLGQPCGNVDQAAPKGGPARQMLAVGAGGGGAQQVVGDGRQDRPRIVGGEQS